MLRSPMNEPIMAARTAIQTVALARFGSTAVRSDLAAAAGSVEMEAEATGLAMALSSGHLVGCSGCGDRPALARLRLGLDGRDHRHARTQFDRRAVVGIERDSHGNALHHLGE